MQSGNERIVIIGTGGTIAGASGSATDNVGYKAGQLSVGSLVAAVPALQSASLEAEQLAQLDSKDMDEGTWARLARRVQHHLDRDDVRGIVITHGTDTLEETAYLLQRVLAPRKPVVLTAAMRPATALQADGPQNLLDAVSLAQTAGAQGVVAVVAGQVLHGLEIRKTHTYRLDAFQPGPDTGLLGVMEEGVVRQFRDWPTGEALGATLLPEAADAWPWVEVLASHGGARAQAVQAWQQAGLKGLVLACTGNGTIHQALAAPLEALRQAGVPVWRTTRCAQGRIVGAADEAAASLTPWAARVELTLQLLQQSATG
ncbi:asparaginase [Roseateles terrae]|uniref:L-asparaginase n=1 Tax=Roseateles terrae TaxID=431060 RepID=A0ABR6GNW5_9BURK|nr:asparaginase [Roseateles terrae]MBB3192944.1 L-asparaginase [Roseateles terrae]OWQ89804.1 L-asparaginase [Roseateles terrae]